MAFTATTHFKVDPLLASNAFASANKNVQVEATQTIPALDSGELQPQLLNTGEGVAQRPPRPLPLAARRGTTMAERYGGSPPIVELPTQKELPAHAPAPIAPVTPAAPKIDLRAMVSSCVAAIGREKAATFFGKNQTTIDRWITGKTEPGIDAAQRILDGYPEAARRFLEVKGQMDMERGSYSLLPNREKLDLTFCIASAGSVREAHIFARAYYLKKYEVGMIVQADTLIIRSRNLIANQFLESGVTWSLWLDSDVIPPFENAGVFKSMTNSPTLPDAQAGLDMVQRLLSHKVACVGGVYSARRDQGPLVIQPDVNPTSEQDRQTANQIRNNQISGLTEVGWLATGLCLVHRDVFLRVRALFSALTPADPTEPFPYFTPTQNEGEDVAFFARVRACGIPLYLDAGLVAGHLGQYCYMPNNSAPLPMKRL